MNRLGSFIYKYIKVEKEKSKMFYLFIILLVTFNFSYYISFIRNTNGFVVNWYDLIIGILSMYMNSAYFYFFIFLLYIWNINSKKAFYKYEFIRFEDRMEWYRYNVLNILSNSVKITIIIVVQTFLEGVATLSFSNEWSEYSKHILSSKRISYLYEPSTLRYIMDIMTPFKYTIISIFFMISFFFVIGLIYLVFSLIFENRVFSFISTFILNCLNIVGYVCEVSGIKRWSFYYNLSVITSYEECLSNYIIYNRMLYWFILALVLIFIGRLITKRVDFVFKED